MDKTNGLYSMNVTGNEQLDDWMVVDYYDKERKPLPANAAFAVSPQPDGSPGMLTYGGDGANGVRDFGTVLFYNADAGSWRTLPNKLWGGRESVEVPAVLDNNQTVWIWGGKSHDQDQVAEPETVVVIDKDQEMSTRETVFPADLYGRRGHSAALGADGHTIYYFGGLKGTSVQRPLDNSYFGFNDISMDEILVFDIHNLTWMKRTNNGSITPSPRYLHTTTQIPGTNKILLYGGRRFGTKDPVDDFCYMYDTESNEWTKVDLPASVGAGPRWGHSGT
ncbi:predicted protein [Lichtheimia corymbifera JMRC:FSU:9682]|uniref:Galactose oxidase n=1 Tax=Lichtheimia corymbifera JMRC:FSU:9682 TaxID=1263082 RepID=A0A068RHB7_9FUNG|nr:predicted protein [Lichtheimia corymbifera JMRC:FSU:9682]